MTSAAIFTDNTFGFPHFATYKGRSIYKPETSFVKKQIFGADFSTVSTEQSSNWYTSLLTTECSQETVYCYSGSTSTPKAYRTNDLNFSTETPLEYTMSWHIAFIGIQKVTGLLATVHNDVLNHRMQVFDPTVTNGSHLLHTQPCNQSYGVLFYNNPPSVIYNTDLVTINKYSGVDFASQDTITPVGTSGVHYFMEVPETDFFMVGTNQNFILLISRLELTTNYKHIASGTLTYGNGLFEGTRSIAVATFGSSRVDIVSFDEINPRECLTFKDSYSQQCASCSPGYTLDEANNNQCVACDPSCATCNVLGPSSCTSCKPEDLLKDGNRCVSNTIDFFAKQTAGSCWVENGYCVELLLYRGPTFIEFRLFNKTQEVLDNLVEGSTKSEDHEITLKQIKKRLFIEISPKNNKEISQTVFQIKVANPFLGKIQENDYFLTNTRRDITIVLNQYTDSKLDQAQENGRLYGLFSRYSIIALEILSTLEIAFGIGNFGMFMSLTHLLKFLPSFRFISVWYGSLLDPFLKAGGNIIEPKAKWGKDLTQENQKNSRGKFSFYEKRVTTMDAFLYPVALYIISFVIRILEIGVIYFLKKYGKIYKGVYHFIYCHNRSHFVIFNIILQGGVMLNLRTLFDMENNPGQWELKTDKILALFCFLIYWIDLCSMFYASTMFIKTTEKQQPSTNLNQVGTITSDNKMTEIQKKSLDEVKSEIEKYQKILNLNLNLQNKIPAKERPRTSQRGQIQNKYIFRHKLLQINPSIVQNLPKIVPFKELSKRYADLLGYKKQLPLSRIFTSLTTNSTILDLSTSNIAKQPLKNTKVLRIEVFMIRARLVFYSILIFSLTAFPLLCSLLIFLLELGHLIIYLYYLLRYRYARNCLLIISKINTGITILLFSLTALIINVKFEEASSPLNQVPSGLQYTCMVVLLISIALEVVIVVLNSLVRFIFFLKNCSKKMIKDIFKEDALFVGFWVKIEGVKTKPKLSSNRRMVRRQQEPEMEGEKMSLKEPLEGNNIDIRATKNRKRQSLVPINRTQIGPKK